MIVVMQPGASAAQVEIAIERLGRYGFDVHRSSGAEQVVLGAIGVQPDFDTRAIEALDGVAEVHRVTRGYRLASRLWKPESTVVRVGEARFGGGAFGLVGVPAPGQATADAARLAADHGAAVLFAGCHPTPPADTTSFAATARTAGLAAAAEVFDIPNLAESGADLLVVGPERMGHVALLRALGTQPRPVLLYRSASATVEEWLAHADLILAGGNPNVLLCESGIRTFETTTHRTLDLSSVPAIHLRSHLPVLVDPSYGTGQPGKVAAMARAAAAAGADGLVVEMHPPDETASPEGVLGFGALVAQLQAIRAALGLT